MHVRFSVLQVLAADASAVGRATLLLGCLSVIGSRASAQTVTGRVSDSLDAPISDAVVLLTRGSESVAARTDRAGGFRLVAKPGAHTLEVRRLGYEPFSGAIVLSQGQVTNVPVRLRRIPARLDSVVATETRMSFGITPGREWVRKHSQLDRGTIVAGIEIERSGLSLLPYLGKIPGLRFITSVPSPAGGFSPPVIPGRDGYLASAFGEHCVYGRIDHWSIIGLLDNYSARTVDDVLTTADVMAVEVYANAKEVPVEWRGDATAPRLIWRTFWAPGDYLIGDIGGPFIPRPSVKKPTSPGAPLWTRPEGAGQSSRTYLTSPDTLRVPSFEVTDLIPPSCGFVQVWTKIAW